MKLNKTKMKQYVEELLEFYSSEEIIEAVETDTIDSLDNEEVDDFIEFYNRYVYNGGDSELFLSEIYRILGEDWEL